MYRKLNIECLPVQYNKMLLEETSSVIIGIKVTIITMCYAPKI